jgi:iron(III) transport system substrate-binding protein
MTRRSLLVLAAALVTLGALALRSESSDELVVYCAHDWLFADPILKQFEAETGIRVAVRYDTEATKSLGLVELIARERDRPRCEVFWNNEPLGTLRLEDEGLLEPYQGPGWRRIPEAMKDPVGAWAGFAARLRVWISRGGAIGEEAIAERWRGDLARAAIAKPIYGTTRAHFTALFDAWGEARLASWYASLRARGVNEVAGNAAVKALVASGACDLGWTDTDDYFAARDAGAQVAMLPVRLDDGATLCLPNTVAIVRGARHAGAARRLVDFLLSEETELRLARSPSRQIPLGPVHEELPDEVKELERSVSSAYPIAALHRSADACLTWLRAQCLP